MISLIQYNLQNLFEKFKFQQISSLMETTISVAENSLNLSF